MKSKFKLVIVIAILLTITYNLISFFSTFHIYAAGSYPYAETYYLKYPEKDIIKALEKMNLNHADLKDKNPTDYWHDISFNLDGKRIDAWTRPGFDEGTNIGFVAVYRNRESGWQLINQDLGLYRNIMIKREFKKKIIERLKIELEK
ncbi:hypothetical protein [Flavobacterium reichenbachii]|uniref:Uncharacterized protein n=1 Tax=Flavobacterium reichenbachii TaxID=362418 RepID=A0A085ZNV4_9FLAO|nr:hypothetical protein [Flavobacterium reichenbachii]KFF06118.1 hypothetical protein IW19_11520 [Flavobacterium reichenbachii]OXB14659.1 hypothetical protein B0A68_11430 [Flavobacterium reichenbachii]